MPQVELLSPLRLNLKGTMFLKGERIEVDARTALGLSENPRFKVTGLGSAEIAEAQAQGPVGQKRADAVSEAIDDLEPTDENFGDDGLPKLDAISKAAGFEVTMQDRARALQADRVAPQAAEAGLIDTATIKAAAEKRGFKVKGKATPAPVDTPETV